MGKVLERGGSQVKVEFSISSTCNSAHQPHALAIWVKCVKENEATATSHQVVLLRRAFAQHCAT